MSLTVVSNVVADGQRTVVVTRPLKGKTAGHYTFDPAKPQVGPHSRDSNSTYHPRLFCTRDSNSTYHPRLFCTSWRQADLFVPGGHQVPFLNAIGRGPAFAYHKTRAAATLDLHLIGAATCVCNTGQVRAPHNTDYPPKRWA